MSGWLNALNERWVTRKNSDLTSGVSVVVEERLFGPAGTSVTGTGSLALLSTSPIQGDAVAQATASGAGASQLLGSPNASALATANSAGSIASDSLVAPTGFAFGVSVVTAIGALPSISVSTLPASGITSAIALGSLPTISISVISGSGGQAFIPEVPADLCILAEARDNDVITYASQMIVSYEARNDTIIASKINPIVAESRVMEVIYNASN